MLLRKEKLFLETQDARAAASGFAMRVDWPANPLLTYTAVFLISFLFLFLGMDRRLNVYDEGLVLTNAMRVGAGAVIHRDFYANYGPAQFYVLAWLFDLLGRSILVERLYDLFLKATIVTACLGILEPYCRKSIALCTAAICLFWLFAVGLIANPIIPALLLSLIGSWLVLPVFSREIAGMRVFAAGAVTGLTALFRYDVGASILAAQASSIVIAGVLRNGDAAARLKSVGSSLLSYLAGFAVLFLPAALLYLAVASLQPFVHDMIYFPTRFYAHARRLPFPGIHWRTWDELAVYLPLAVIALVIYRMIVRASQRRAAAASNSLIPPDIGSGEGFLILFGLLSAALYFKGLVRVGTAGMLLSIVPALLILAVLFEHANRYGRVMRIAVTSAMAFSLFTATWSALKEARRVFLTGHASVLQELLSPPGPRAIREETDWCHVPNVLHTGLCFLVDPDNAEAISFVAANTNPKERIFVGDDRHDKIYANNNLIYFAADRLPATKWSHFDPDLQTTADIQTQMIHEIDSQAVHYILLDSEFDSMNEPNDSSRSSGVTLLDDYIRRNYREAEMFGEITVWQRK